MSDEDSPPELIDSVSPSDDDISSTFNDTDTELLYTNDDEGDEGDEGDDAEEDNKSDEGDYDSSQFQEDSTSQNNGEDNTMGDILDVKALMDMGKLSTETQDGSIPLPSVFNIDTGNLLVFDQQEQSDILFSENKEEVIKDLTQRCVQELFDKIFNLPVKNSNKGPIAQLPPPKTPIPREKPVPQMKPETRWEKFAKEKGIKNRKRTRMLYDEGTDTYKPRWGKGRINDPKDVWIMPDKPGELERYGVEDPFLLEKVKKKERTEKNKKLQVKNLKRAAAAQQETLPPTLDITKNAPRRQKYSLERAVELAQLSTASMGKFDKLHRDEPAIKVQSHLLSSSIPKELKETSKIAERVLKKSKSLNVEKAVREELRQPSKSDKKSDKKSSKKKKEPKKPIKRNKRKSKGVKAKKTKQTQSALKRKSY